MKTLLAATLLIALPALGTPPETLPPGMGRYVMVLWHPGSPLPDGEHADREEPDVKGLGGTVLASKDNKRVLNLPLSAANEVRRHRSVSYLQRIWMGESLDDWNESFPSTASRVQTNAGTEWSAAYEYDSSGNITKAGENEYVYDTAGRLISADVNARTETYNYDAFGNLVQRQVVGYPQLAIPVDPSSNRLVGPTYDAAGNVALNGVRAYTYDGAGKLVAFERPDYIAGAKGKQFLYDANDEQIGEILDPNYVRWTIRDEGGRLLREYKSELLELGTWVWEQDYIYAGSMLVGGETQEWGYGMPYRYGGRRHYHLDHLGSVRMMTTDAKSAIAIRDYYPFGVEQTPLFQEEVNLGDPHMDKARFAGHIREPFGLMNTENTDYLDNMHARFYDPNLGRFLSVDPGKDWDPRKPQSWNMYSYVRNNPINMTDPTGRNAQVTCQTRQDQNGSSHTDCTATVTAQIVATNRAERQAAQQFANSARAYWNNKTVRGRNGENIRFNVNFNIVAPNRVQGGLDTLTVARAAGRSNVQMTLDIGMPGPLTPDRGTIYTRDSTANPSGMRGIAPHETGHLFGLKDLYGPSGIPQFVPGPQHSIMEMAQPDSNPDYGWWVLHPANGNTTVSYVP